MNPLAVQPILWQHCFPRADCVRVWVAMKILCSSDMPFAFDAFRTLGETHVVDGRRLSPEQVRDVDLLAIRSTTRVDRRLLKGSRGRFVGTATIGFDHLDTTYLEAAGIRWCYSPGCNANSVAEYVVSAILCLATRHTWTLENRTLGVVGVGHVGRRVVEKARALGMRVLQNDPPRERAEGWTSKDSRPSPFVSLDLLLAEADIVTLHVPLTREGPDPTWQLADETFFSRMRQGATFINSSRGAVVKTDALRDSLRHGHLGHAVVDTWEGEPVIPTDLLEQTALGTPHIAGYSYEGKVMGTLHVYREACRFLGVAPTWSPEDRMPSPPVFFARGGATGLREEEIVAAIVRQAYDIERDDRALRQAVLDPAARNDPSERGRRFDRLRIEYPIRREFPSIRVVFPDASERMMQKVAGLGFAVSRQANVHEEHRPRVVIPLQTSDATPEKR